MIRCTAALLLLLALSASLARSAETYIVADDIDQWHVERFSGHPGVRGFLQGPKLEAAASGILAFDSKGNAYVACGTFIQIITRDGQARILTGTPGVTGNTDGPPWKTTFGAATDIALAGDGRLFVVDGANFTLRRIEKRDDGLWHTETVAGVPGVQGHRDGPGAQALFATPFDSVAVDENGVVYTLDGNWLRKFENGTMTTLNGGTGRRNGALRQALFDRIMGGRSCLAYDGKGNLYVGDRWGMAVRKVDLQKKVVTTVAGCQPGVKKGRPKDGPALDARFHPGGGPVVVFYNRKHDFVIVRSADEGGRIRRIGGGWMKTFGPGPGKKTALAGPWRNAVGGSPCGVDGDGNVYVAGSRIIRVVRRKGVAK
jgi:hypothetical protein